MTLANKFSRCFSVSNIGRQPLVTWKFVYATIFSFYLHLQAKKRKLHREQLLINLRLLLLLVACISVIHFESYSSFDVFAEGMVSSSILFMTLLNCTFGQVKQRSCKKWSHVLFLSILFCKRTLLLMAIATYTKVCIPAQSCSKGN